MPVLRVTGLAASRMSKPSQHTRILNLLRQRGSEGLTARDFFCRDDTGLAPDGWPEIRRLAARIDELHSRGYAITSTLEPTAGGARVSRYRLIGRSPAPRPVSESPAPAPPPDLGAGSGTPEPLFETPVRPAGPYDDVEAA